MPSRRPRGSLGLIVAVSMALAVVGCSATAHHSHASQAAGIQLLGPDLSPIQVQSIQHAEQELLRRCLTSKQYTYIVQDAPLSQFITKASGADLRYIDTAALRTEGFGFAAGMSGAIAGVDPNAAENAYLRSLSPARAQGYSVALYGTQTEHLTLPDGHKFDFSPGGCEGEMRTRLYGGADKYIELFTEAQDVASKIDDAVGASSQWQDAMKVWQQCMSSHGYTYGSSDEAAHDIGVRYAAPGANRTLVHQYEMTVAAADATCVDRANLNEVSLALVKKEAASMSDENVRTLLAWDEMEKSALATASKILGGGS